MSIFDWFKFQFLKYQTKKRIKGMTKELEELGCTDPMGRAVQAELAELEILGVLAEFRENCK
jgi:hypothetical protein